jgi:hypothetical protein
MDIEDQRIAKALGVREVPDVNEKNLIKYRKFLLERLDKTTVLTGREDFPWEEMYVFGPGDPAEYQRLKKSQPSYKDEYTLIGIAEQTIEETDLVAKVQRLSDKKHFQIGLSWLTTLDDESRDFQALDDFATWVANWCN